MTEHLGPWLGKWTAQQFGCEAGSEGEDSNGLVRTGWCLAVTVNSRSLSFRFEESNETGQGRDIIQKNLLPGNAQGSLGEVAGWRFLRETG